MSKNKTFHSVTYTFENDDHPIVIEWFGKKMLELQQIVKVHLADNTIRQDKFKVEFFGNGTMVKLTFITNFLGDEQLYTSLMGYVNHLIGVASQYVEIKTYFECNDTRRNRFALFNDFGLMIKRNAPLEVRSVGNVAYNIGNDVNGVWVAGEPNLVRKVVGRIRYLLRSGNKNVRFGYDKFIKEVKLFLGKDAAVYVTREGAGWGEVIHDDGYSAASWQDPFLSGYVELIEAGKAPDVFDLVGAKDNYFDFPAFMAVILERVEQLRQEKPRQGGWVNIPNEFIQSVLKEITDVES
ncbi:hypothetical protein ST201phi2-1p419 [Pseudomonas phage 201phi2-1]|uniref:Uncharacterized protein n=1 Tax=Pseudomonas phage 201phi2-1 TaxID=198110 RepID=B3FJS8_BP201|nr:hypothetical protein ST201phi2-1p419 [Pseudomonas phage 201phi2-1]ABY63243.1 hypothetical protein 201phi2-1p419 [Pseudomonas phage 201phi2-1]